MHPRAQMFLMERARAQARGDAGVERCMNVELERMGYMSPPLEPAVPVRPEPVPMETAVPEPLERAVPPRGGRPKLPRCEHGQIVGRCAECEEG